MLLSNKTISRILETLQEQIHLIGMSGLTLFLQPIFISHCTFFLHVHGIHVCLYLYRYTCVCETVVPGGQRWTLDVVFDDFWLYKLRWALHLNPGLTYSDILISSLPYASLISASVTLGLQTGQYIHLTCMWVLEIWALVLILEWQVLFTCRDTPKISP